MGILWAHTGAIACIVLSECSIFFYVLFHNSLSYLMSVCITSSPFPTLCIPFLPPPPSALVSYCYILRFYCGAKYPPPIHCSSA